MDKRIIYSPLRSKRPINRVKQIISDDKLCPFCIHNENMTTEPVYISEDKEIRIVPNKYPVITTESDDYGYCDVVIDTLSHTKTIPDYTDEHLINVLKVMRNRVIDLYKDEKIKYVQVFKNQGLLAGASQSHSHWQIIGMDKLPVRNRITSEIFEIERNDFFVSYTSDESIFDYCISIKSLYNLKDFKSIGDNEIKYLAKILKSSVKLLTELTGSMYNICFYEDDFKIDIIPRTGTFAGFEISTGYFIKSISSQKAQLDYIQKLKEINS